MYLESQRVSQNHSGTMIWLKLQRVASAKIMAAYHDYD